MLGGIDLAVVFDLMADLVMLRPVVMAVV